MTYYTTTHLRVAIQRNRSTLIHPPLTRSQTQKIQSQNNCFHSPHRTVDYQTEIRKRSSASLWKILESARTCPNVICRRNKNNKPRTTCCTRSLALSGSGWLARGSRESLNHSSVMAVTIGSPDPSLFPTRSMLRRSVASHLGSSGFSLSLALSLSLSTVHCPTHQRDPDTTIDEALTDSGHTTKPGGMYVYRTQVQLCP